MFDPKIHIKFKYTKKVNIKRKMAYDLLQIDPLNVNFDSIVAKL